VGQNFRNIIAWQKADDLVVEIYHATQKYFPRHELFALTQQLHRAAISVAANIAEGAAKRTTAEYRAYLDNASGSLNEVEYYIHLSRRLGYIDEKIAQHLFALEAEAARTLNGLINAVDKQIASGQKLNRLPAS